MSSVHPAARDATTRHREAPERRSFASTSSASDFAHAWRAFHSDKAALELEIGFGDPEHLAASLFRLLGNVRDLSGRLRFVAKAAAEIAVDSGIP